MCGDCNFPGMHASLLFKIYLFIYFMVLGIELKAVQRLDSYFGSYSGLPIWGGSEESTVVSHLRAKTDQN